MADTTSNKAIFEIDVKLDDVNKAIAKADDLEKAFLESQKNILRNAKANNLKKKRELDKQLKEGLITRKEHGKKVVALEKQLANEIKNVAKTSGRAKIFIAENAKITKNIRATAAKQKRAIEKQLKAGVIDKKKAAKEIIAIEKKKNKEIVRLNRKTQTTLDKLQKRSRLNLKKSTVDTTKFGKTSEKGFGQATSGAGKMMKKLGAIGVVVGVVVGLGRALTRLGSRVIETANKVEAFNQRAITVFGDELPQLRQNLDGLAQSLGLTETEALKATGATADLLIPIGATRKEAAEMSLKTLEMAGALKQFSGDSRDAAEISNILTKAYLGEREGLKSLGIAIQEADIKQQLLARGTSKLTGEALALEKAMITQELIFKKSADARAAFADSTDSAQQRTNRMAAAMKTFAENGSVLLAAFFAPFQDLVTNVAKQLNGLVVGVQKLLNIANAQSKAVGQGVVGLHALKKATEDLVKAQSKMSVSEFQKEENRLLAEAKNLVTDKAAAQVLAGSTTKDIIAAVNAQLNVQAIKTINVIDATKKQIATEEQQFKNKVSQVNAFNKIGAKLQATRAQVDADDLEKSIKGLKAKLSLEQKNLNLINQKTVAQKKSLAVPTIAPSAGLSQIDVEDTTQERLEAEQRAIQQRIELLRDAAGKELELKAALLAEKDNLEEINNQKEITRINELEQKKKAEQIKFNKATTKAEQKQSKIKLKSIEKDLKKERKMEATLARNKARIRRQFQKFAEIGHRQSVDLAEALFSREKFAFKRLLASKIKELGIFLSKELALKAATFAATGRFGLAAAAGVASGIVLAGGFAASRAINESIDADLAAEQARSDAEEEARNASTEDFAEETATAFDDVGEAPAAPVTIINNNVTNNNTEITELGTYVDQDRFIREAVRPTLQEIEAETGGVGVL